MRSLGSENVFLVSHNLRALTVLYVNSQFVYGLNSVLSTNKVGQNHLLMAMTRMPMGLRPRIFHHSLQNRVLLQQVRF
jgi:hypothetical protein